MIQHRVFRRGQIGPAKLKAALDELGIQNGEEFVVLRWSAPITRALALATDTSKPREWLTESQFEQALMDQFGGQLQEGVEDPSWWNDPGPEE